MFRESFFEYAGKYSGDFNLVMAYIDDDSYEFDSGSGYEIKSDNLPAISESLLYGLNKSEKPLSFSVEIVSLNNPIPFDQMREIKRWLFGQDGWKKLKIYDDKVQDYHLKCMFIPDKDITDVSGYRGVKCTLTNISPFWYGEDKTIEYTKETLEEMCGENGSKVNENGNIWFYMDVDAGDIDESAIIDTTIKIVLPKALGVGASVENNSNLYIDNRTTNSKINYNLFLSDYMSDEYTTEDKPKTRDYLINTKYCKPMVKARNSSGSFNYVLDNPTLNNTAYDYFHLKNGINTIGVRMMNNPPKTSGYTPRYNPLQYLSFTFTPMYRIGGF